MTIAPADPHDLRDLWPALALLFLAGMTNHRSLTFVLLPLFITLAGACAPDEPTVSMSFMSIPAGDAASPPDMFVSGQCLDQTPLFAPGGVACAVVEARHAGGACSCDATAARVPAAAEHADILSKIQGTPQAKVQGWDCFCEIPQLEGADGQACRTDTSDDHSDALGDGFCYADATITPAVGDPEVTRHCPAEKQRFVRFVGKATLGSSAGPVTRVVACEVPAPSGG